MAMTLTEKRARRTERAESKRRIEQAQKETRAIVTTGICPECGSGLQQNLALTGWWQCDQYGADGFRKDDSKPACGWQGFTKDRRTTMRTTRETQCRS
ncbi:hypothetical protein LCGC14_0319670 [marine sediment metagenome]|uniref:Bacteriophage T7 Gp4 DNA primase/helicase N-terminal domain-containing protein n=1 Tax=marine sediment metagenome TaxID=412755 RepID=A0A0F9TPX4_9ZZZZ